jgi:hypothetical protein
MEVDPLASMRCWPIEVELGGRVFDIPALAAVDWWPVLTSGDLADVLDFVVSSPGSDVSLDDLILEGALNPGDFRQSLVDAVETAAGRSLHVATVLAVVAGTSWASINGALIRRGFRWEDQPLGAALDAVYAEITSRLDKDDLAKFEALLENESLTQPGGKRKPAERVVNEFESMAGPKPTAGVVSTGAPSGGARPRTRPRPRPPRPAARSGEPRPRPARRAGSGPEASP